LLHSGPDDFVEDKVLALQELAVSADDYAAARSSAEDLQPSSQPMIYGPPNQSEDLASRSDDAGRINDSSAV